MSPERNKKERHKWTTFETNLLVHLLARQKFQHDDDELALPTAFNTALNRGKHESDISPKEIWKKTEELMETRKDFFDIMNRQRVPRISRFLMRVWERGTKFSTEGESERHTEGVRKSVEDGDGFRQNGTGEDGAEWSENEDGDEGIVLPSVEGRMGEDDWGNDDTATDGGNDKAGHQNGGGEKAKRQDDDDEWGAGDADEVPVDANVDSDGPITALTRDINGMGMGDDGTKTASNDGAEVKPVEQNNDTRMVQDEWGAADADVVVNDEAHLHANGNANGTTVTNTDHDDNKLGGNGTKRTNGAVIESANQGNNIHMNDVDDDWDNNDAPTPGAHLNHSPAHGDAATYTNDNENGDMPMDLDDVNALSNDDDPNINNNNNHHQGPATATMMTGGMNGGDYDHQTFALLVNTLVQKTIVGGGGIDNPMQSQVPGGDDVGHGNATGNGLHEATVDTGAGGVEEEKMEEGEVVGEDAVMGGVVEKEMSGYGTMGEVGGYETKGEVIGEVGVEGGDKAMDENAMEKEKEKKKGDEDKEGDNKDILLDLTY